VSGSVALLVHLDRYLTLQAACPVLQQFEYEDNYKTITMKADPLIPDEEVTEMFAQYPSCATETLARRYALGLLGRSLKEIYRGSIVILGNPSIKPHDYVYIKDDYSDMVGIVEVARVTHLFSKETGFLTEIKPNLIVHMNEDSTITTRTMMGVNASDLYFKSTGRRSSSEEAYGKVAGDVIAGISGTLDFALEVLLPNELVSYLPTPNNITGWIANHVWSFSNYEHPVAYSPVIYKGRPLIAGVPVNPSVSREFIKRARKFISQGVQGLGETIDNLNDNAGLNNIDGD